MERVSISWYDAIHNWKGWIINNNNIESLHNNIQCIHKYKDIVENKLYTNNPQKMVLIIQVIMRNYFIRDLRFALSIETQK